MMICIVFYKITKIAFMLWLAERHDYTKVCKQSCDLWRFFAVRDFAVRDKFTLFTHFLDCWDLEIFTNMLD